MIDMSDAVAQDAMKRAISIDNLADLELQAASQINQSIQTAAPGSAPIIEAQADAWLVRSNAYTQAALADLMRVQAVDLASAGAGVKMGATNALQPPAENPTDASAEVSHVLFSVDVHERLERDR